VVRLGLGKSRVGQPRSGKNNRLRPEETSTFFLPSFRGKEPQGTDGTVGAVREEGRRRRGGGENRPSDVFWRGPTLAPTMPPGVCERGRAGQWLPGVPLSFRMAR
jgi:hypothetical protein